MLSSHQKSKGVPVFDLYDDVLFHHAIMPTEVSFSDEENEVLPNNYESFSPVWNVDQASYNSSDMRDMEIDMILLPKDESFSTAQNGDALSYTSSNLLSIGTSHDDDLSLITDDLLEEFERYYHKTPISYRNIIEDDYEQMDTSSSSFDEMSARSYSTQNYISDLSDLDISIVTTSTPSPFLDDPEGSSIGFSGNTSF